MDKRELMKKKTDSDSVPSCGYTRPVVLTAENLTKDYGKKRALDAFPYTFEPGI